MSQPRSLQEALGAAQARIVHAVAQLVQATSDAERGGWVGELTEAVQAFMVVASGSVRLCVSVEEAAKMLGISRAFAYECVAEGLIPALRLAKPGEKRGRILVPVAALHQLVQVATNAPPSIDAWEGTAPG